MNSQDLTLETRNLLLRVETLRKKVTKSTKFKSKFKRETIDQLNNMLADGLILYDNLLSHLAKKGLN